MATKSPDLNLVDYAAWWAPQQSIYRTPISGLDNLKDRVHICLENLDQKIIDNYSVDQWHNKLKAVD